MPTYGTIHLPACETLPINGNFAALFYGRQTRSILSFKQYKCERLLLQWQKITLFTSQWGKNSGHPPAKRLRVLYYFPIPAKMILFKEQKNPKRSTHTHTCMHTHTHAQLSSTCEPRPNTPVAYISFKYFRLYFTVLCGHGVAMTPHPPALFSFKSLPLLT